MPFYHYFWCSCSVATRGELCYAAISLLQRHIELEVKMLKRSIRGVSKSQAHNSPASDVFSFLLLSTFSLLRFFSFLIVVVDANPIFL